MSGAEDEDLDQLVDHHSVGDARAMADQRVDRQLLRWAERRAEDAQLGLEGAGSDGAGLARFLRESGHPVAEVNRPTRQTRHVRGKSDPIDAEAAARAGISGEATSIAKQDDDRVGVTTALRVARRSAVRSTTQTVNQVQALSACTPVELREQFRRLPTAQLITMGAAFGPGEITTPAAATKLPLCCLPRRHQGLSDELARLAPARAPALSEVRGVGVT